jgi:hypothetical protein
MSSTGAKGSTQTNKKTKKKGSNKKSKRQPKAALVWLTGLSGVPPDSVWCTREIDSGLASFGNSGSHSAIIHRIVRCNTGLSGVPAEQRLSAPTVVCKRLQWTWIVRVCAQKSEQRQKAHRTVNSVCPVHHRTVRWPHMPELQRSNPNGWVTWLVHRTVRCAIRQQPSPMALLVVGAINTANHQHFKASKFLAIAFNTRALDFTPRHKQRDQILSQVQRSFQSNSD